MAYLVYISITVVNCTTVFCRCWPTSVELFASPSPCVHSRHSFSLTLQTYNHSVSQILSYKVFLCLHLDLGPHVATSRIWGSDENY